MNKTTTSIEIDLDVFKALNNKITYIGEPFNEVLRKLLLPSQTASKSIEPSSTKKPSEIINLKIGVDAKGIPLPNGKMKVLKGSKFRKEATPNFTGSYALLRSRMIKEGHFNSNMELKADYEFDSPSAAASVILGSQRNANPWESYSSPWE